MRRWLFPLVAIALLPLVAPQAAAQSAVGAWSDLPPGTEVVAGQPVTITGHSRGTTTSGVKFTELSLRHPTSFVVVAGAGETDWSYTFTPGAGDIGPMTVRYRVNLDDGGKSADVLLHLKVTTGQTPPVACPCTSAAHGGEDPPAHWETVDRELGLRFFTDRPGYVSAVQVTAGAGVHPGMQARLWEPIPVRPYLTPEAFLLARSTEASEDPATGVVTFTLPAPVLIDSYTEYTVSYTVPAGALYRAKAGVWTEQEENPAPPVMPKFHFSYDLHGGTPGVFGAGSQFPHQVYDAGHYWVTPVFTPSA
jgi:hypothetical protein